SELDRIAGFQLQLRFQIARSDRRALGIQQNGHSATGLICSQPDSWHDATHPVVFAMTHVKPENISALIDQAMNHLGLLGGGPERTDDLGSTHPSQVLTTV